MNAAQQLVTDRRTILSITPGPYDIGLRVNVPAETPYRRIFGAFYFFGGVADGQIVAKLRFRKAGKVLSEWKWQWRQVTTATDSTRCIYAPGNDGVIPPFSVAFVPDTSAGAGPATDGEAPDLMIAAFADDLGTAGNYVVRMAPVKAASDCDEIELEAVANYTGTLLEGWRAILGVRSNALPW